MDDVDWHMIQMWSIAIDHWYLFPMHDISVFPDFLRPHTMPKVCFLRISLVPSWMWVAAPYLIPKHQKPSFLLHTRPHAGPLFLSGTSCVQSRVFMSTSCFLTSLIVDPRLQYYLTVGTPSSLPFLFSFPVRLAFSYSTNLLVMFSQRCSTMAFGHRY